MRKLFVFFSMYFMASLTLMAQTNLRGVVYDSSNDEPLIGVSISIKGGNKGTITDSDGKFQISVTESDVLVFSYIGYAPKEVNVGKNMDLTVYMDIDATMLEEAVITTALGIKRDRRALGYAISTVTGDDLLKAGTTINPFESLYGKAAGVGVQATAAGPMGGMKINIRGAQGLDSSSNTRPLFVVDGVPMYDTESSMATRGYDPLNSFDYGSAVNDINSEDIEDMTILKGAKASILYGSRGANGVVLITTKKGAGTRGLGVSLSYGHEWHVPFTHIDFQNEYGSGANEYAMEWEDADAKTGRRVVSSRYNFGPKFDGSPIIFFDGTTRPYQAYENNYLDMFETGGTSTFNAAISGGTDKSNMRISYTNQEYNGMLPNEKQMKNSVLFNGQAEVSKFARFEFMQSLTNTKNQNRRPNLAHLIAFGTFNRDYDIETAMNSYVREDGYMRSLGDLGNIDNTGWGWPAAFTDNRGTGFFNVLWNANRNRNMDNRLNSVTSATAFLSFTDDITLKLRGGMNYTQTEYTTKHQPTDYNQTNGTYTGGKFAYSRLQTKQQEYEALFFYDKSFMQNRLHLTAFAGGAYVNYSVKDVGVGTMNNFKFPNWWSLKNHDKWPSAYDSRIANYSEEGDAEYSILGSVELRWDMEFVLEMQMRRSWSSTLPKANRAYNYPGVSATWNFTERFSIPKINYGKFYASWADVGRAAPRYYALRTYSMNTLDAPRTNVNDVSGPKDLFSGDLKPERKREVELGFDLRMFPKNRLEINFAYYNNTSYNQIMGVPLSAPTGAEKIRINAGKINNQGIELFVKGAPVDVGMFRWELSATTSRMWDKIDRLYPGITEINSNVGNIYWRKKAGEEMNTLWAMDYKRDENGNRIVGGNGHYILSTDPEDEIKLGTTNTKFFGGLTSNFYFKGNWGMLNVMAGFDYKVGGKVLSYSNYYLIGNGLTKETLPYRDAAHGGLPWTETLSDGTTRERHDGLILPGVKENGEKNDIVISAYSYYSSFIHDMSTGFQPDKLMDNNYVKFRELAVHYTFPKHISEKMRLQKLMVGVTARNLGFLYKSIPNIDPEALLGTSNDSWTENSNYPSARYFGFKVNVSF